MFGGFQPVAFQRNFQQVSVVTVQPERPAGGWYDYSTLRERRRRDVPRETPVKTPEEIAVSIAAAQQRLEKARELRRAELKSRLLTEEIRQIYIEQDSLRIRLKSAKQSLEDQEMDEEDVLMLILLSS